MNTMNTVNTTDTSSITATLTSNANNAKHVEVQTTFCLATFTCPVVAESTLRCLVDEEGRPWFIGREVATLLGYSYPKDAVRNHCKHAKILRGESVTTLTSSPFGLKIIPEPDLYHLIMHSTRSEAEAFQDWVYEEVLPSIRKYGAYINESTLTKMLANPDYCLSIISNLDAERKQRKQLEKRAGELEQKVGIMEDQVCVMTPKALVYDTVIADRTPTLRQFARRLGKINLNNVTRDMCMLGYFHRTGGVYHPYAKYRDSHFSEKVNHSGVSVIVVLDEGKKLLTKLWAEGKLSRRK